jgi:integrase
MSEITDSHIRAGAKIMAKSNLRLVPPDSKLRTVTLRRRSNRDMGRDREHLTELDRLMKAAKGNRHGQRDATMILIGFRHGLRVSELCDLQWSSIAFETGTMHVRRAKGVTRQRIRSSEMSSGRCGSSSVSQRRPSSSPRSVAGRIRRLGSLNSWPVPARRPRSDSRSTRTCCATPAAMRWPTRASIPGRCRLTSAIARSTRPRAMPRWRPVGSRTFGGGASSARFEDGPTAKAPPGESGANGLAEN